MEQKKHNSESSQSLFRRVVDALKGFVAWFNAVTLRDGNPATDKRPDYACCLNCGATLEGMYCHKCGQKAIRPVPKVMSFVWEYFSNVFSIERKTLPTLCNLIFHPAHLIKDFYSGRQSSYLHPLKLNIMFLVIMLTMFAFFGTDDKVTNSFSSITTNDNFSAAIVMSSIAESEEMMEEIAASPRDTIVLRSHRAIFDNYSDIVEVVEVITPAADENDLEILRAVVPRAIIERNYLAADDEHIYDFSNEHLDDYSEELMLPELTEAWNMLFSSLFKHLPLLMLLTAPILVLATRMLFSRRYGDRPYLYIYAFYYLAFVEMVLIFTYIFALIFDLGFYEIRNWLMAIIIIYLTVLLKKVFDLKLWSRAFVSAIVINFIYIVVCAIIFAIVSVTAIVAVMA